MRPSTLKADKELQQLLTGKITSKDSDGATTAVTVYTDGERSGVNVPDDFIDITFTGDVTAVDCPMDFVKGYLLVTLYVKLNSDNTIKKNRVDKILSQFDTMVNRVSTDNYYYEYLPSGFLTPTTAYTTIGYSMTILSLKWHTR